MIDKVKDQYYRVKFIKDQMINSEKQPDEKTKKLLKGGLFLSLERERIKLAELLEEFIERKL